MEPFFKCRTPSVTFTAAFTLTAAAAHANSFTTGNVCSGTVPFNSNAGELTFSINGDKQMASSGNFVGSTGIVNGKAATFNEGQLWASSVA